MHMSQQWQVHTQRLTIVSTCTFNAWAAMCNDVYTKPPTSIFYTHTCVHIHTHLFSAPSLSLNNPHPTHTHTHTHTHTQTTSHLNLPPTQTQKGTFSDIVYSLLSSLSLTHTYMHTFTAVMPTYSLLLYMHA